MRDLTKSVTSYTWAMSVFWTQQLFKAVGFGGNGSGGCGTKSFNNVTEATSNELGSTMRAVFRSGDTLQRGMIDLLFAPFSGGSQSGGGSRNGNGDGNGNGNDGGNGGRQGGRGGGDGNDRGNGGWVGRVARVARAGTDVMQAAVDTAAGTPAPAADSKADAEQARPGSAPRSHDPSVGWGPMPR